MLRRRFAIGALASLAGCGASAPPTLQEQPTYRPSALRSFRLLTYNVLADVDRFGERFGSLSRVIEDADADVLSLQEVNEPILGALLRERWASRYEVTQSGGKARAPGGQLLMARHRIGASQVVMLSGKQRRTAVISTVSLPGLELTIANTHMESFLEDGPIRARQLEEIFSGLAGAQHAILAGDLNFGDGEQPETAMLADGYFDAWTAIHGRDPGFTWNIDRSEMARIGSFVGETSRRLDRVLVRSPSITAAKADIVGNAPVVVGELDLFPSDHFGLVVELQYV